jgi:hypothetical protein
MNDRELLAWIHERLEFVHHEDPHVDYMHALRAIVLSMPPDRRTVNYGSGNTSADMRKRMANVFAEARREMCSTCKGRGFVRPSYIDYIVACPTCSTPNA